MSPFNPVSEAPVYLFVDLSNLSWSAREEALARGEPAWALRLHAEHLFGVLAAGRRVDRAVLIADARLAETVLRAYRRWFDVRLAEPGLLTGKEQGADEKLQVALYETLYAADSGTIVLATGDGAGWKDGRGFCPAIRTARREGLGIEVVAFARSFNRTLRTLASNLGAAVLLDEFYESVTFLEGGRRFATPLGPRRRPTANPERWAADDGAPANRTLLGRVDPSASTSEVRGHSGNGDGDPPIPRWDLLEPASRTAWPRDLWGSAHLSEWIEELQVVSAKGEVGSEGGAFEDWMNAALDRVGLQPGARARLAAVIDEYVAALVREVGKTA